MLAPTQVRRRNKRSTQFYKHRIASAAFGQDTCDAEVAKLAVKEAQLEEAQRHTFHLGASMDVTRAVATGADVGAGT